MALSDKFRAAINEAQASNGISIRPIENDDDLWYAVVECRITPEQEEFVNPAGFSIGRAYLDPDNNLPCVIYNDGEPVGYIVLRIWRGQGEAVSWSYYIDVKHQGCGYGREAAKLAVRILKAACPDIPVKLSAEADNHKAQRLYQSIGFKRTVEKDGDDLVFEI